MSPSFLAALRRSYSLFPESTATIRISRRRWWSGLIIPRLMTPPACRTSPGAAG